MTCTARTVLNLRKTPHRDCLIVCHMDSHRRLSGVKEISCLVILNRTLYSFSWFDP